MSLVLLRSCRHHAKVWTKPSSKSLFIRSLASSSSPTTSFDHVRRVFDDEKYYQDFNNGTLSKKMFSGPRTGLFKNEKLTTPQGLIEFSGQCLTDAQTLVEIMIKEAETSDRGKIHYIRRLDQLSDILCRVIDVAEFIRVAHPNLKWTHAAQQTHELMFEYMNQLNTNVQLHTILGNILADASITSKLSNEEIMVGEYLKQDFERSGIYMEPHTRENFVALTQEISVLGSHFNNGIHELKDYWCEISQQEYDAIDDADLKREIRRFQQKSPRTSRNSVHIPLAGSIPYSILQRCSMESVRRKVWIALHNASEEQILTLNLFLKYRATLAKMLGYDSFAHYQLEHKMAKNPENVLTFLENLQRKLVDGENSGLISELESLYAMSNHRNSGATKSDIIHAIKPWDRDYLLNKLQEEKKETQLDDNISEYLSVGTIMSGLSQLFHSIYNIELLPEPTASGETWATQVRKIKVFDNETQSTLGYLYLDFWLPNVLPSHFTIVCLRQLNKDLGEKIEVMRPLVQLDETESHQLPVISLVCNFHQGNSFIGRFAGLETSKPTLLTLDQVDTIFHEMGHAMHSMIGRTKLQNLSGTRCLTDFVELPSVLMESFSKDPRVLGRIARHYNTNELLPHDLLAKHQHYRGVLENSETYMQSKMAMLDQVLHGKGIVKQLEMAREDIDSTTMYHSLEKELKVFSDQWSTWHGKFPHLFSYGAVYFSYLFDRAIAEKIWKSLFESDPWSRKAGTTYKEAVLKWGGTRDPWHCLADALSNQELSKGDEKAMRIIGGETRDL